MSAASFIQCYWPKVLKICSNACQHRPKGAHQNTEPLNDDHTLTKAGSTPIPPPISLNATHHEGVALFLIWSQPGSCIDLLNTGCRQFCPYNRQLAGDMPGDHVDSCQTFQVRTYCG